MASKFFTKTRKLARWQELKNIRAPHMNDWERITQVIRPARGKYDLSGSEISRRPTSMINSTPAVAARTLQAGMISGASSPAYEWFKFEVDDAEMMGWGPARIALEAREKIVQKYLARSNFYQMLQIGYGDSADFGTGAGIIDKHPRELFVVKTMSPGEYAIDVDEFGDVDTIYGEYKRTCLQLVGRFGYEKVSQKIRDAYDKGDYNTPFIIMQAIEPNQDLTESNEDWRGKPWVKFIWEVDNRLDGEAQYLEISGYDEWPGFDLRWDMASGNVWGMGPGLLALGDAAALQTIEFRDAQAIEKALKPPLKAPIFLKNQPISHAPGGVTYYDPFGANNANLEPIYQMQAGVLQALSAKRAEAERRVNEVYYKDLFLMLATTDRREITAREVEEKHQEKLLALGPVLQRTHRDALSNSIIRVYKILDEAGVFPEPPPELREREITIRYTSALAYAQRAAGAASLERFFGFTGNLAGAFPAVRHKVNIFKGVDYYADAVGVPAEIMLGTKEAEKAASAEAQQAQGPAQAAAVKDVAQGAELLSRADTTRPSALQFLLQRGGIT